MTEAEPVLEEAARAFAAANAVPPFLYQLSPEEGRRVAARVQADPTSAAPEADVSGIVVQGGPTGSVRVSIVRPQTHDRLVRELVAGTGPAVVFPDYDLAPGGQVPDADRAGVRRGHLAV